MEIVKGPSAATLYGTDAANGVVLITTKRGRAGTARWTIYGEGGMIKDNNTYPTNYTIFGTRVSNGSKLAINGCNLPLVSSGFCTIDSVAKYNLFEDPDVTPLGTGYRNQYGLQLSGGNDLVRYFVSGEREDETGMLELPAFERRRLDTLNIPIRDWTERPNVLGKNSVRANINAAVSPKLDLSASTGFINLAQRYSLESNATAGLGSQAFGGPGCKICAPNRLVGTGSWRRRSRVPRLDAGLHVAGKDRAACEPLPGLVQCQLAPDRLAAESPDGGQRLHQPRRRQPALSRRGAADQRELSPRIQEQRAPTSATSRSISAPRRRTRRVRGWRSRLPAACST
ncbi:MAG: hypothetical protein IPP20_16075 [Gemmatimonadetes bacterium]|nr:hypothetical protein [Gemmatimonadota bacterium]